MISEPPYVFYYACANMYVYLAILTGLDGCRQRGKDMRLHLGIGRCTGKLHLCLVGLIYHFPLSMTGMVGGWSFLKPSYITPQP